MLRLSSLAISIIGVAQLALAAPDLDSLTRQLGFKPGPYELVNGSTPCVSGYVGWMTEEERPTFALGHLLEFRGVESGVRNAERAPDDKCTIYGVTTAETKTLRQVTVVDCPAEKVDRVETATFTGRFIKYHLVIKATGKPDTIVNCTYSRQGK